MEIKPEAVYKILRMGHKSDKIRRINGTKEFNGSLGEIGSDRLEEFK